MSATKTPEGVASVVAAAADVPSPADPVAATPETPVEAPLAVEASPVLLPPLSTRQSRKRAPRPRA